MIIETIKLITSFIGCFVIVGWAYIGIDYLVRRKAVKTKKNLKSISMSIASKNGYGVTVKPKASFDVGHSTYHILNIEQVCHTWFEDEDRRKEMQAVTDHYLNFIFHNKDSSTTITTPHLTVIFTRSTK